MKGEPDSRASHERIVGKGAKAPSSIIMILLKKDEKSLFVNFSDLK